MQHSKLFADDKLLMEYKCLANSGCHNQYRWADSNLHSYLQGAMFYSRREFLTETSFSSYQVYKQ